MEDPQTAIIWLDAELRLCGFTPAASEVFAAIRHDVGRTIDEVTASLDYVQLHQDARRVLNGHGQIEREIVAHDGKRWFQVRLLPSHGADGALQGVVATFVQIADERSARVALRKIERRFVHAQQLAGLGAWEWDLSTDESWWSPRVYELWGMALADQPAPLDACPIHPQDKSVYQAGLERARRSGELAMEWRVILKDGSIRWLAASGGLNSSADGEYVLGVTQDVTERKKTEDRQKQALSELQHRVRNVLGVVRSVVARTMRNATSIPELSAHLDGRLHTLARTQAIFMRTGVASVDFAEVIREELVLVAARDNQVHLKGPAVRLRRQAAETLTLVAHELTTNAVKYGALSEPAGRVSVIWRIVNSEGGRSLCVEWRESGVRALDTSPAHSGFGRELIERGLPYELGATTSLQFAPGGVRVTIELPLTPTIAELTEVDTGFVD